MIEKQLEFLRHSNNIEGVWDDDSLIQAWKAWAYCISHKKMTATIVKETHSILTENSNLIARQRGAFRVAPVFIGGREALHYSQIEPSIEKWLDFMNSEDTAGDWKGLHVMYEGIHPFIDFNGRTGRIFMNWHRRKNGLPLLVIEEPLKQDYYAWFPN